MVEPLSVAIGIGVAVGILLAFLGLMLVGYVVGRRPDHIVDMSEVSAYYRHRSAAAALSQDVQDSEE
jgi:xanthine/uracil/vitamin C permease (AzgA family)